MNEMIRPTLSSFNKESSSSSVKLISMSMKPFLSLDSFGDGCTLHVLEGSLVPLVLVEEVEEWFFVIVLQFSDVLDS